MYLPPVPARSARPALYEFLTHTHTNAYNAPTACALLRLRTAELRTTLARLAHTAVSTRALLASSSATLAQLATRDTSHEAVNDWHGAEGGPH